jgi:hypothetical protein
LYWLSYREFLPGNKEVNSLLFLFANTKKV